jgi:hypothetical protein
VDANLFAIPFEEPLNGTLPEGFPGLRAGLVVADADGRLHRLTGRPGAVDGGEQRLTVDLVPEEGDFPVDAEPSWPLSVVSIELTISTTTDVVLGGTVAVLAVEATDDGTGWSRLPMDPVTSSWRWTRSTPGFSEPFDVDAARISLGSEERQASPVFPQQAAIFRQIALPDAPERLAVLAGPRFMELTGASVGDELPGTTFGARMPIRIAGVVPDFPPLDPAQPFVVVDAVGLELNRFALTGQLADPDEWWLDVEEGRAAEVVDRLDAAPFENQEVVDRVAVARSLSTDPVSLGLIGALGLGSVAAMVFAAIGFIVSATVSTSERVGEFALLRALGLSGRQLAVWLSVESAFLLFVGLLAGSALGVLMAWLVLPFATLTETGLPAIPSPVVVVPWQAIAPTWALAVVLLAVTILIVRRQLPSVRISGVLRARDE